VKQDERGQGLWQREAREKAGEAEREWARGGVGSI
jgi:hypothetical protein